MPDRSWSLLHCLWGFCATSQLMQWRRGTCYCSLKSGGLAVVYSNDNSVSMNFWCLVAFFHLFPRLCNFSEHMAMLLESTAPGELEYHSGLRREEGGWDRGGRRQWLDHPGLCVRRCWFWPHVPLRVLQEQQDALLRLGPWLSMTCATSGKLGLAAKAYGNRSVVEIGKLSGLELNEALWYETIVIRNQEFTSDSLLI